MPSKVKTIISTIGSIAAATMVVRKMARHYLPPEFQDYIYIGLRNFIKKKLSKHLTMVIYESDGFHENEIYNAIQFYVAARMSTDIHRLKVSKTRNDNNIAVAMEVNEEFTDIYKGVKLYWSSVSKKTPTKQYNSHNDMKSSSRTTRHSLELTFHRDYKDLVLNDYLPFVLKASEMKKQEQKTLKLFTVSLYSRPPNWMSVNLDHPANFTTLAMDSGIKEKVIKDLDRFVERREYYRKVGKAWKRGYLLYGPPGTGKSSLIAAMANYLNFDIYDLELTNVHSNSDLRALLLATTNRSILVVEDIDCSVALHDRVARETVKESSLIRLYPKENKVTLSGFLNLIDGLWSSCGDERIIIFTTNRKNKLDPALLRPGRMDVHIHMSYLTPCGFRQLVTNYLGITQHSLLKQIDDFMCEIKVTPAEIAEQLLKDDDPDIVLSGLIEFFDVKRKENEEAEVEVDPGAGAEAKPKAKAKAKKGKEKELGVKEDESNLQSA
ncbi:unnamed protein product [Lactuca virosa]|uniref:AAA+ ATPase domain-containing protein n=1 Tax=Lactuca virosa TaxID=75947 RepID=A0AAU9NHJ1_9ASTR|nr:unnamed protein product [Lactuca virosa]